MWAPCMNEINSFYLTAKHILQTLVCLVIEHKDAYFDVFSRKPSCKFMLMLKCVLTSFCRRTSFVVRPTNDEEKGLFQSQVSKYSY